MSTRRSVVLLLAALQWGCALDCNADNCGSTLELRLETPIATPFVAMVQGGDGLDVVVSCNTDRSMFQVTNVRYDDYVYCDGEVIGVTFSSHDPLGVGKGVISVQVAIPEGGAWTLLQGEVRPSRRKEQPNGAECEPTCYHREGTLRLEAAPM